MKTLTTEVNSARMIGNNGAYFLENTNWSGVAYGFMPHNAGCKITAVKIEGHDGNTGAPPAWLNTTLDLDAFIPAGLINNKKAYITELTVTGACTLYLDNKANEN